MGLEWKMIDIAAGGFTALASLAGVAFYVRTMRRARNLSPYALPDRWPQWDTSEQTAWFAHGRYTGSWLHGVRCRMPAKMPVLGKGFEKAGKGRIWLLAEALVFQRDGGIPPIAIPYALIHACKATAGTVPESQKWLRWSHCFYPSSWPLLMVSFLPYTRTEPSPSAPPNFLHVTWGRRELPVVSEFQVSSEVAVTAQWAQEIKRRARAARRPGFGAA